LSYSYADALASPATLAQFPRLLLARDGVARTVTPTLPYKQES